MRSMTTIGKKEQKTEQRGAWEGSDREASPYPH
jgi:hypothetical protein